MGQPDGNSNPHRHTYGDFTHRTADGYRFEWTPFFPAVKAWENVCHHLRLAVNDLSEARGLKGFGLNGLGDDHAELIGALTVLIEDTRHCHEQAGAVFEALRMANNEYAKAKDASLAQYQALTKAIDGVITRQRAAHTAADNKERAADADQDRKVFPFDGTK